MAEDEIRLQGFDSGEARKGPGYDIAYFRKKRGITTQQAAPIIRDSKGSRSEADIAALRLRGKG